MMLFKDIRKDPYSSMLEAMKNEINPCGQKNAATKGQISFQPMDGRIIIRMTTDDLDENRFTTRDIEIDKTSNVEYIFSLMMQTIKPLSKTGEFDQKKGTSVTWKFLF